MYSVYSMYGLIFMCSFCEGTPRQEDLQGTQKCIENSIRLVGGEIEQEGRIELCVNGLWGSVCGTGFTQMDAYVACKHLGKGITAKGPVVYSKRKFGDGIYPIAIANVSCEGWEKDLTKCAHSSFGSFTCSNADVAEIVCFDDCEDGDVRLIGDEEGTVEVCVDGLWGMVAESGWSLANGQVVCNQIGYIVDGIRVFNTSYRGKSRRPVNIHRLACKGTEERLLDCEHFNSSPLKISYLPSIKVASVQCSRYVQSHETKEPKQAFSGRQARSIQPRANQSEPFSCSCNNKSILGGVFTNFILLLIILAIVIAIGVYIIWTKIINSQVDVITDRSITYKAKQDLPVRKNLAYGDTSKE